jgi:hypothetical protein
VGAGATVSTNPTTTEPFYRVEVDSSMKGCEQCNHGTYWTIVYDEDSCDDAVAIGTSWADRELAEDICDLMNMAYERRQRAVAP